MNVSRPLRASVYWNTHKGRFSVLDMQNNGKLHGHAETVALFAARPIIQHAGQEKSIATGTKTVHAFLRGWMLPNEDVFENKYLDQHPAMFIELMYNWRENKSWRMTSPTMKTQVELSENDVFNRLDLMIDNHHQARVYVS